MPTYIPYRDDLETTASNEAQTHAKIIELMTDGMNTVRAKQGGKAVRISHAKAHALVKGELRVLGHLPPGLAQGLFSHAAKAWSGSRWSGTASAARS